MTRRYFHPDLPSAPTRVDLATDEATHAAAVMRVRVGDAIEMFDGKGGHVEATVSEVRRNRVWVDTESTPNRDAASSAELTVVSAIPNGDRGREMVTRMTELGVTTLVPLLTDHSQRPPSDAAIKKLRRSVIEACKQCGRNRLMDIETLRKFSDVVTHNALPHPILLHPAADPIRFWDLDEHSPASLVIGPEGGFSDAEVTAANEVGWTTASLGESIYRIETAVAVSVTLMIHARSTRQGLA